MKFLGYLSAALLLGYLGQRALRSGQSANLYSPRPAVGPALETGDNFLPIQPSPLGTPLTNPRGNKRLSREPAAMVAPAENRHQMRSEHSLLLDDPDDDSPRLQPGAPLAGCGTRLHPGDLQDDRGLQPGTLAGDSPRLLTDDSDSGFLSSGFPGMTGQ